MRACVGYATPGDNWAMHRRPSDDNAMIDTTSWAETEDDLGIGSFGGGSDHFTGFGAGTTGSTGGSTPRAASTQRAGPGPTPRRRRS